MLRTRVLPMLLAATLAAGSLAVLVPIERADAAATALSSADAPARAWAPEWMVRDTSTYTEAEARSVARRYDVVAAHADTFKGLVGAMKDENPRLRILIYVNGPFGASYLPDYPESWYAHNAAGGRVKAVRFDNYLMDVHLPAWRAEVLRLCKDSMATSGYDGCFLDSLGNGIIKSGYLDSDPIDPRTSKPWTLDQYITDTAGIAAYLRSNLPGVTIAANGLGSGPRYFNDGTTKLADSTDIAMAEAWIRGADAPADAWPNLTQWRQNVDMLADAEARGSGVLTVTKLWTTVTNAQRKQWYDFALGSFMLGTGPNSRFFFIKDGCKPPCAGTASPLSGQWAPDGALGDPQGAYRQTGGAYVRDFANGFVAVNPGDSAVTVALPTGSFTDQDGTRLSGSVTLAGHTGRLLEAGAVTPPPPPPPPPAAPAVAIDLTPGTTLATGATTTSGLAVDDSAVRHVHLTIKNLDAGTWLQPDGTWSQRSAAVGADLEAPDSRATGWSYSWRVPRGLFLMTAQASDDRSLSSSVVTTLFAAEPLPPPVRTTCGGLVATIVGTAGADLIAGTAGRDVIAGLGGDDVIFALGGDDVVCGGAGTDTVLGGRGNDRIEGGDGMDLLRGDAGADVLLGNAGDDSLAGGHDTDRCSGGGGTDLALACESTRWTERH